MYKVLNKPLRFSLFLLIFLIVSNCSKNNSSNVPLTIAPYQKSAITIVSPDGKNSKACSFEKFTGEMLIKKDAPASVTFSVQTNSMATSDKKLVELLKEKDFFDTTKYPTAEFKSTSIKKNESTNAAPNGYVVSGSMEIKGKKINLDVPAIVDNNENEISLSIQLPITSKDWLATFSTSPDAFFKDHLDVVAKLVFPKPVKIEEKKNLEIKVDQKTFDAIKENTLPKQTPSAEKKIDGQQTGKKAEKVK